MTRATLLHVLDRPTALGPAEVRELEQLAQAFPYCQTAHLLLAKAAHDQGTMLAGQRLRRAATYAADRALLRRLIEQVEPAATEEEAPQTEATPAPVLVGAAPSEAPVAAVLPEPARVEGATPVAVLPPPVVAFVQTVAAVAPVEAADETVPLEPTPEAAPADVLPAVELGFVPDAPDLTEKLADNATYDLVIQEQPTEALALVPEELPAAAVTQADAEPPALSQVTDELPLLVDQEGVTIPSTTPEVEPEPAIALKENVILLVEEPDLPAQAPAIRPPVEVGEARFEFGLAETPTTAPAYELPGLIDEWAASAVTLSLGSPDALAPATAAPPAPTFTPAAFTGDAAVGYAFGESSRLGLSMQLLDLLAAKAETVESHTAVVAAAQPPAVPLPPVGTFFEPDPLLLDHWATHCPTPPELPSTLDLINNFLRRQPRLTRPAMLPPAPGGQTDLSVRSTRTEPDLVSENLARIYVRQGKNTRAKEVFEKLIVKHPEKAAYYAAQIQQLEIS